MKGESAKLVLGEFPPVGTSLGKVGRMVVFSAKVNGGGVEEELAAILQYTNLSDLALLLTISQRLVISCWRLFTNSLRLVMLAYKSASAVVAFAGTACLGWNGGTLTYTKMMVNNECCR